MEQRIKELEAKIAVITNLLEKVEQKQSIHYHIKHLEIKQASIEQLDYHLDSIDIEQLSGTLNIGNNFDTHEKRKSSSNDKTNSPKQKRPCNPVEVKGLGIQKNTMKNKSDKIDLRNNEKDLTITARKRGFSVKLTNKEEMT
ncbi:spore germination protein GerPC [Sutcliffiella halmapala]|uniref:spore germination protein GerPC n=1 Tax=Sutcliffiella halmapala TaxID=79882 RepID=UPI001475863F|nr:spore germination protein GerPC [Sutcliffiella halmapala]